MIHDALTVTLLIAKNFSGAVLFAAFAYVALMFFHRS